MESIDAMTRSKGVSGVGRHGREGVVDASQGGGEIWHEYSD